MYKIKQTGLNLTVKTRLNTLEPRDNQRPENERMADGWRSMLWMSESLLHAPPPPCSSSSSSHFFLTLHFYVLCTFLYLLFHLQPLFFMAFLSSSSFSSITLAPPLQLVVQWPYGKCCTHWACAAKCFASVMHTWLLDTAAPRPPHIPVFASSFLSFCVVIQHSHVSSPS